MSQYHVRTRAKKRPADERRQRPMEATKPKAPRSKTKLYSVAPEGETVNHRGTFAATLRALQMRKAMQSNFSSVGFCDLSLMARENA